MWCGVCEQAAAQEGIPPAIYNLGNMYAAGVGVAQSDENARACYEGAAGWVVLVHTSCICIALPYTPFVLYSLYLSVCVSLDVQSLQYL